MSLPYTPYDLVRLSPGQIDQGLFNTTGYKLVDGQFTYSIPTTNSAWLGYTGGSEPYSHYAALTTYQASEFSSAMALWDSYIAPNITQVSDTAPGFIRVAFTQMNDSDTAAYAYTGNGAGQQSPLVGDIWINDDDASALTAGYEPGSYEYETFLHEIGHTLGLKHSFEDPVIPSNYDTTRYTVMSYTDPDDSIVTSFSMNASGRLQAFNSRVYDSTPMVLDIQAVQDLYGADPTTRAGDDSYDFTSGTNNRLQTIYDAAGTDTIIGTYTLPSVIDLRPGSYSSIGYWSIAAQEDYYIAQYGNFYADFIRGQFVDGRSYTDTNNVGIAFSTTIENAVGGLKDDILIGNDVANHLSGGDGKDVLTGGGGADVLTGGAGVDVFSDTAANLNGDTVTDMTAGEYFKLTDGGITGGTYYLAYDRGTATLDLGYHGANHVHVVINPSSYFGETENNSTGYERLYAHNANLGDFTHDLQSDLMIRDGSGVVSIDGVRGEESPLYPYSIFNAATLDTPAASWSLQGPLDFNGDLSSDLLWHNQETGQIAIWTGGAQFQPGFNEAYYVSGAVALDWQVAGIADFNDDGRDDVLWRKADGTVTTWLSTGIGANSATGLAAVDHSWHIQGAADVNGDGFADLVWRDTDGSLTTWTGSAGGFSTNTPIVYVDPRWHVDAVADVTGDGVADLLWRNDNGAISVWSGTAGGFIQNTYYHAPIGNEWQIAGTGDYNGDGNADILWHNVNGAISIWQSTGLGAAAGFAEGTYTNDTIAQNGTLVVTHYDLI